MVKCDDEYVNRFRVNGSLLNDYIGKPVSLIGTIISTTPDGASVLLKTTDEHIVTINMRAPLTGAMIGIVEFRGTCQTKSSIICDDYTTFPDEFADGFDAGDFNEAIMLMHAISNPWTAKVD